MWTFTSQVRCLHGSTTAFPEETVLQTIILGQGKCSHAIEAFAQSSDRCNLKLPPGILVNKDHESSSDDNGDPAAREQRKVAHDYPKEMATAGQQKRAEKAVSEIDFHVTC
jgi:hypothetical protein